MAALVVFDTVYGNTAEVARAIGDELGASREVRLMPVNEVRSTDLMGAELLVIGSPTRGFRPTPAMQEFIGSVTSEQLHNVPTAVFDTRLDPDQVSPAPLKWAMKVGGFAGDVLRSKLAQKGARSASDVGGFFVDTAAGPLRVGEIERARGWARQIAAAVDGSISARNVADN